MPRVSDWRSKSIVMYFLTLHFCCGTCAYPVHKGGRGVVWVHVRLCVCIFVAGMEQAMGYPTNCKGAVR